MVREGRTVVLPSRLKPPDMPEMVTEVVALVVLHVRVTVSPGSILLGLAMNLLMTGCVEGVVSVESWSVVVLGLVVGVGLIAGLRPDVPEALGLAVAVGVGVPAGVGVIGATVVDDLYGGATTSRMFDHGVHWLAEILPRIRNS